MTTGLKSAQENQDLNDRLRSLRIDRTTRPAPGASNRAPKKLLLALSVLIALIAVAYVYFSASAKTVTVAEVTTESGTAASGTVLTVSGYVVAHHRIDVGAKVMGRVAWIGVEKGDKVTKDQILVRLEDQEFRAQANQAKGNLAAAQARLDQLRAGSRPQEKLKDRAGVIQAEANLRNAQADFERIEHLHKTGVASKADLDRAIMQRDSAAALL